MSTSQRKGLIGEKSDDFGVDRGHLMGLLAITKEIAAQSQASQEAITAIAEITKSLRISEKLYLSVEEAAKYSGLPKSYLVAAIHDKRLAAVKAGRWCINRKSLEAL